MNRITLVLTAVVAMAGGAAGCGGSGSCTDGCNRMRACAEKLSCAGLDPIQQTECNRSRKALLEVDCSNVQLACEGSVKERFERAASCPLNPINCECQ